MTGAWLIARRELAAYAKTPAGYFIAGGALVLLALLFHGVALGERRASTQVLEIFLLNAGFVVEAAAVLLAQRLWAREAAEGTDALLLTSPLSDVSLALGKFLAGWVFLVLIIALSLYLPGLIFVRGTVSFGHIAAGYLGLFGVAASSLALASLASALVPKPFVATLIAGGVIGLLELGPSLGAQSDMHRELLQSVAPVWSHFRSFRRGLVQGSDVAFFVLLTTLGIAGTALVIGQRRSR